MEYREHPEIDLTQDKGKINLPTYFRKQVDFEILKMWNAFYDIEKFHSSMNRECYRTDEVLSDDINSPRYPLSHFMLEDDSVTVNLGDLLNIESSSQLADEQGHPFSRDESY